MRAVIQRVLHSSVKIDGKQTSVIGEGLLVFLGIVHSDTYEDADWLSKKISKLRIFNDDNGIMNLDVQQANGEIMVVSQFTLHAQTKKGNRPSYIQAAPPEKAIPLYKSFIDKISTQSQTIVRTGEFGAMMEVELLNNGPVTIIIDTKNKE